jgi:hypothetical protein
MKTTFTILFTLACSFTSIHTFGQESGITGVLFSNEDVSISTEYLDCVSTQNGTAKQYLNITVQNKKNYPIRVSFKKELWYNGTCINCESNSNEYLTSVEVLPGESISSSCESNKQLKIFFKMLELKNVRQLSHFELKDINVQKL